MESRFWRESSVPPRLLMLFASRNLRTRTRRAHPCLRLHGLRQRRRVQPRKDQRVNHTGGRLSWRPISSMDYWFRRVRAANTGDAFDRFPGGASHAALVLSPAGKSKAASIGGLFHCNPSRLFLPSHHRRKAQQVCRDADDSRRAGCRGRLTSVSCWPSWTWCSGCCQVRWLRQWSQAQCPPRSVRIQSRSRRTRRIRTSKRYASRQPPGGCAELVQRPQI